MDIQRLSVHDAQQKIDDGALLIHTLPEDHFHRQHLPGAHNACVYLVTFLDTIRQIVPDQGRQLILYGSSSSSMDAVFAAEKLQRAGYRQVFVLEGGLAAWRDAGLPLEGEAVAAAIDPATRLPHLEGIYRLDTEASVVGWSGRNQNSKHEGFLRLKEGHLQLGAGPIRGELTVDMDSMENTNLAGDELQPVLIAHLKSDDFFFTSLFPTATLTIDRGELLDPPSLTARNCRLAGELHLRGVRNSLDFTATLTPQNDGGIRLEAHFDLDRTRWNIIYGSTRFFEHLGMHTVFDDISIELRLELRPMA